MSKYRKALAAIGGVLAILASALSDGLVSSAEVESVILAAVSAFFVYRLPNKPADA